jgi:hypothetical protein
MQHKALHPSTQHRVRFRKTFRNIQTMKQIKTLMPSFLFGGVLLIASNALAQTTPAPQPSICNRACWTARAGSCTTMMSSLTRAIIHHTAATSDFTTDLATAKTRMRATQNYHIDSKGWCDIAYHFLVSAGGHIFEGRGGSMASLIKGNHAGCGSVNTFGFTFLGYFHPPYNQVPPVAMRNAMYDVIAWRMPSGWTPYGGRTTYSGSLHGTAAPVDTHQWVGASTGTGCGSTACPGDIIINNYLTSNFTGGEMRTGIANRRALAKTARNVDNTSSGFTASSSWLTGTSSADKLGTDYRFRSTAALSDAAQWATTLNISATWNVRAWWPQGANRSASAPYIVSHGAGTSTVNVNQQANGGQWNLLGSWSMGGAQTVKLSCWTTTGFVVVADGIRWD